ncbi:ankyrin repeat-containing protein ITN1-like [Olea europaea var. sylvestris]|uniref:Ankyrin repeat-containing ITN1-like n=1 Tax=Olea europaea subsp. europaea TaxID=158383 RepID=A0A8S0S1I7_OLEEU|nr:ankyrin repeat-containing protein ITN1-like [Olea europaea var. sylvestris]CAA2986235.1 ankyrin repeat-containing ITN1-like [Olea europaea subsp. europaea]
MNETIVFVGDDDHWIKDLNDALDNGTWESIERIIHEHPNEVFKARLNENGDTLLLLAFNKGKNELINKLVEKITPDLLAETDIFGNTALHLAAKLGLVQHAEMLVGKKRELLNHENKDGFLPIQLAVRPKEENTRSMTTYLLDECIKDKHSKLVNEAAGAGLMESLIKAGFYDLALKLLKFNKKLAWRENFSLLEQMARDPGAFLSGCHMSFWQILIYFMHPSFRTETVPPEQNARMERSAYEVQYRDIPALRLKNRLANELVGELCSTIKSMDKSQEKLGKPLLLAAQNGIFEVVIEILHHDPTAITYKNGRGHSIFHVAVMYRDPIILGIAFERNKKQKGIHYLDPDVRGNNILHLVGYKPHQAGILTNQPGAIFPMREELQWFVHVSALVTPQECTAENNGLKIPFSIFVEEHAEMAEKEIEWMTAMASASSVAASLVATVAFAAAFQVPGGNSNNGIPNFSNETSFKVFAISDALALFFSITSVLSFLSIFTSRNGVHDYLRARPSTVIIVGHIALLISFIYLIIAFSSTLFLIFAKQNERFLIPIIIVSCIPVILYGKFHLHSLFAMIKSTFMKGLLFRRILITVYAIILTRMKLRT